MTPRPRTGHATERRDHPGAPRRTGRLRGGFPQWTWIAIIAPTSALIAVAYGPARLGYDALFALIWGRQLYRLELPTFDAADAPTPHPLANIVAALLAPLGDDASATAVVALACVAFGAAGYAAWLTGSRLFGPACGLLFALLVLTRPGLVVALLFASTDLWFVALVLLAGAQIAHRPMASTGPLVALALAGLLRPEAWALAITYVVFLAIRRAPARRMLSAVALMLVAPVIWMSLDWVWAGDPLHSLRATRELAAALERPRGLGAAIDLGAEYLAALLGEPLLWAGLAGCIIVTALTPERAMLPAAVLLTGMAGFAILAIAGLPLIERYLVLPALALTFFAAAATVGWPALPHRPPRRAWMVGAIAVLGLGAALLPAQVRELRDVREQAAERRDHQLALRSIASQLHDVPARCVIEVPSFQDVQAMVLFADLPSRQFLAADRPLDGRAPAADLRVLERSSTRLSAAVPRAQARGLVLIADAGGAGC